MRDFMARFRFGDFAAYFLPGLVMLCAILSALTLTIYDSAVRGALQNVTIGEGLLLACGAYVLGAFLSGSSRWAFPHLYRISRPDKYCDRRTIVFPPALRQCVLAVTKTIFGDDIDSATWSEDHFYLIRSVVNEKLPHAAADASRQNDLMRLRENMVVPLITLWAVSLGFAWSEGRHDRMAGLAVAVTSTLAFFVAARWLVGRASDNRRREVREVCTAFVVGYRLGMFEKPETLRKPSAETTDPERPLLRESMEKLPIKLPSSPEKSP
jgi:hypothetical protein